MVDQNKKQTKKKVEEAKVVKTPTEDPKINELKIELLKSGAKRKDIKREIARLLTLQQTKMEAGNKK